MNFDALRGAKTRNRPRSDGRGHGVGGIAVVERESGLGFTLV